MHTLIYAVLVAFGGALVLVGGYHALVIAPQLRRLQETLFAHDTLLGGGGAKATDRLVALEAAVAESDAGRRAMDARVGMLENIARTEIPSIGFVRYNAFPDTGSDLSYALALLNRSGDGVVLSSIWSREETRTYGKAVQKYSSTQDSSKEELEAIAKARAATA